MASGNKIKERKASLDKNSLQTELLPLLIPGHMAINSATNTRIIFLSCAGANPLAGS